MGTTAPLRPANRWLRSTARRMGERVGYVAAMPGRLLREAALHVARQPRIRGVVHDLLSHNPGLRLRVKRLVMVRRSGTAARHGSSAHSGRPRWRECRLGCILR